jgi:branched-chain amino acid transport system permease protein
VGTFLENLVTSASLGSIYALISIGMTMVYGLLKILHVAHAGVYVLGAFLGLIVYQATGSILLAFPVAAVGCAALGYLLYRFVYRRVQDQNALIPLIVGIGLFTAMSDAYRLIAGPYSISFKHDFAQTRIALGSFHMTANQILVIGSAVTLLALAWFIVNKTTTGLAWRASAQDRDVAMGIGVDSNYYFGLNFMFGSALAGCAGVLVGLYYGAVNSNMGEVWAYKVFVVMVLGGLGNVAGTVMASYLLGLAETFIISYWGYFLPRDAIAFICMILVLIFVPSGVMGKRRQV